MKAFDNPHMILEQTSLLDWFLEIVRIDTQASDASSTNPSTAKQLDLQNLLREKLAALGCRDIELDDKGYLFATYPGNVADAPTIGLLAHVDTAEDFSGTNVKPQLHKNYDGKPLAIGAGVVIDPAESKELMQCLGDTIVTAGGDTLLGADDKAGVVEILALLQMLGKNPDLQRPLLRIAFTPDEEVGRGAEFFDVQRFGAACAYTLDGEFPGEVNFETFSADKAIVTFTGVAVHPGYAKDKMVNALRWLGCFLDRLPKDESPERTDGRVGFYHPIKTQGNAAEATVELILREFDNNALAQRGTRLKAIVAEIAKEEPRLKTHVEIKYQYRNMADELQKQPLIRDNLLAAVRNTGLEPKIVPVRGGTDGSGLTAKGLPTPNIFAGGVNFHGPREWVSTRAMALAVCTLLNLVQLWAKR